jgi:hypothetical protein
MSKGYAAVVAATYGLVPGLRLLILRAVMVDEWRLRFRAVGADPDMVDRIATRVEQAAREAPYGTTGWVYDQTDRTCRAVFEAICAGEVGQ